MEKNTAPVLEALKNLEEVCPEIGDIFEDVGVIIDDLAQLYFAKDPKKFLKEKKDLRTQLKYFKRKIDNATFKAFGKK